VHLEFRLHQRSDRSLYRFRPKARTRFLSFTSTFVQPSLCAGATNCRRWIFRFARTGFLSGLQLNFPSHSFRASSCSSNLCRRRTGLTTTSSFFSAGRSSSVRRGTTRKTIFQDSDDSILDNVTTAMFVRCCYEENHTIAIRTGSAEGQHIPWWTVIVTSIKRSVADTVMPRWSPALGQAQL